MSNQILSRRRRWWKVLVAAVATAINPLLGLAVAAAFEYFNQQDNESRIGLVQYTDGEVATATNNLNNVIVPTVNKIAEKLQAIHAGVAARVGLKGAADVIATLNEVLTDVAILQSYVDYVKTLKNNTLLISLQAIEPFLAQLNVLVTETINNNNLQSNVEKAPVKVISSNHTIVNGMQLNWNGQEVVKQYEALVHVTGSTSETVITVSDNQTISDAIQTPGTTPTATNTSQQPAKSNGVLKAIGWTAFGIFITKVASSSKKKSK